VTGCPLQPASFLPLHCSLDDISITLELGDPPPPTPSMLERWARATASNPRLFNGPILRYMSHSGAGHSGPPPSPTPASGAGHSGPPLSSPSLIPPQITARHDTYQRYAMQPHEDSTDPNTAIYHLAVTGVLTTRDDAGRESVLLARRGPETFIYPDRWEHAPGGGLENGDIYSQLLLEMEEELGLPGLIDGSRRDALLETPGPADVLGLVLNPSRPSVNIAVRVRLRPGAERAIHPASWESTAIQLVRVDALAGFLRMEGSDAIVPPTLAIWRGLGWVAGSADPSVPGPAHDPPHRPPLGAV
jgi:8-oxo-dGTP pyrophosphatase MutT (NUDIX family)